MYKHFIFICIIALMGVSCSSRNRNTPPCRPVKVDTVRIYGNNPTASFPGKIIAASDINMAFRVSGTLLKSPVVEGKAVRKGEVIARIDPRDYKTKLDAVKAEYNRIKGEADRIIAMYKENSISANDYEKAVYGLQQITAKLEATRHELEDTELKAPFDGFIQKIYFEGEETVAAGMPVVSIINNGMPEVEINIPITDYARRGDMKDFRCKFDIFPDRTFPLELIGINKKANLNQLYKMRLRMCCKDESGTLSPGMTTMVNIEYRKEGTRKMSIPTSAIVYQDNRTFVWVYSPESNSVKKSDVKVESIEHYGYAIISEGPEAGELIISAGVNSIDENTKIKVLENPSSTNIGGLL